MRLWGLLLVAASVGYGQVSPVRNIQAGKLACAGRILANTQFQTWCYKGTVLGVNLITDLSSGQTDFTYTDNIEGEVMAKIQWIVTPLMNLDMGVQNGWAWQATITISNLTPKVLNGVF